MSEEIRVIKKCKKCLRGNKLTEIGQREIEFYSCEQQCKYHDGIDNNCDKCNAEGKQLVFDRYKIWKNLNEECEDCDLGVNILITNKCPKCNGKCKIVTSYTSDYIYDGEDKEGVAYGHQENYRPSGYSDCPLCKSKGTIENSMMYCENCDGNGDLPHGRGKCEKCNGTGYVNLVDFKRPIKPKVIYPCKKCYGKKIWFENKKVENKLEKIKHEPCEECKGTGESEVIRNLCPLCTGVGRVQKFMSKIETEIYENYDGTESILQLWKTPGYCVDCKLCDAKGYIENDVKFCEFCFGTGYIEEDIFKKFCSNCKGAGYIHI